MNISDPIADLLTRIRNAVAAGHQTVDIPHSKNKSKIAGILKKEGFIVDHAVEVVDGKLTIRVYLKYGVENEPVITGIKRISRPGLRQYVTSKELPRVLGGLGVAIISTSKGLLTDRQARKAKIGGEVMCYVW